MAYATDLGNGVTVKSRDVRLSTGLTREHTVMGSPLGRVTVWEDRRTMRALTYVNGAHTFSDRSLSAAYARVR